MKSKLSLITFLLFSIAISAQDSLYTKVKQQLLAIEASTAKNANKLKAEIQKYGLNSDAVVSLKQDIKSDDSMNIEEVKKIIKLYGWLGYDQIGNDCNLILFNTIQKADLQTQITYFPIVKEAVKNKKALKVHEVYLQDRIYLNQGRHQIYGSQVLLDPETEKYFVLPLDDVDNVDKIRAEVGLQPMADYISKWDLKWDVEKYKKDLSKYEKRWKKMNVYNVE
jgi:hypothetical protein